MNMIFILVLVLFLSIYGLINFYIGIRFWQAVGSNLHFLNNKVYWAVFIFIVFSYILGRAGKRFLPGVISNGLISLGSYWMAAMIYFLIIVIIVDILRLFYRLTGLFPSAIRSNSSVFILGMASLVIVILVLLYGTINSNNIRIKKYTVDIGKQAGKIQELHAVMLSDLHLGDVVDNGILNNIVDKINGIKPDIVFIPGDIIDDDINPYIRQNMMSTFRKINSGLGVYASLGNHDYYGGNIKKEMELFKESNLTILRDDIVKVADSFYIAGREDNTVERMGKTRRKPVKEILKGIDSTLPVILLDHQPNTIPEAEVSGVDLQLSGHTHKGQLFPGDLFTKALFKIDYGYLKKDNYNIIVSSGAGTWGPKVRIGTSSEIVDLIIRFGKH